MRTKKIFLALVAFCLVACLFVTSCAKDGGGSDGVSGVSTTSFSVPSNLDKNLFGTWTSTSTTVIFKEDGSSTLGKWGTDGGKIYFSIQNGTCRCPYSISGDKLTIQFDKPESGVPGTVAVLGAPYNQTIEFTKKTETSSGTGSGSGSGSGGEGGGAGGSGS